jgi:hypothetical protein
VLIQFKCKRKIDEARNKKEVPNCGMYSDISMESSIKWKAPCQILIFAKGFYPGHLKQNMCCFICLERKKI